MFGDWGFCPLGLLSTGPWWRCLALHCISLRHIANRMSGIQVIVWNVRLHRNWDYCTSLSTKGDTFAHTSIKQKSGVSHTGLFLLHQWLLLSLNTQKAHTLSPHLSWSWNKRLVPLLAWYWYHCRLCKIPVRSVMPDLTSKGTGPFIAIANR